MIESSIRSSARVFIVVIFVLLDFIAARNLVAIDFDVIRDDVQQDLQPSSRGDDDNDREHNHDHKHRHRSCGHSYACDCDDGDSILGQILGSLLSSAFNRDKEVVRRIHYEFDDGSTETTTVYEGQPTYVVDDRMSFASFPYAAVDDGYMFDGHSALRLDYLQSNSDKHAGRIAFEFGSNFDDVNRYTSKFLLEGSHRWGIDADWNYYTQRVAVGVQDYFNLGDVNVLYRFIETEKSQWRIGLGANWFDSRGVGETGINATLKMDYYPVRPVIFSGELDYGRVGGAEMFHGAFSLGVNWRNVELFSGYDFRKIGPVDLHGPLFGIRIWW